MISIEVIEVTRAVLWKIQHNMYIRFFWLKLKLKPLCKATSPTANPLRW